MWESIESDAVVFIMISIRLIPCSLNPIYTTVQQAHTIFFIVVFVCLKFWGDVSWLPVNSSQNQLVPSQLVPKFGPPVLVRVRVSVLVLQLLLLNKFGVRSVGLEYVSWLGTTDELVLGRVNCQPYFIYLLFFVGSAESINPPVYTYPSQAVSWITTKYWLI